MIAYRRDGRCRPATQPCGPRLIQHSPDFFSPSGALYLTETGLVEATAAGLALAVAVGSRAIDRIGVLGAFRER